MDPLISIITVVYNGESTLKNTIESVLAQTYTNIEYIIVDGLSTDRTLTIAESYIDSFKAKGIVYRIISEKDSGLYDAMNKGIKNASGNIIGLINSDDWYEPDALETVVKCYNDTHFDMMYANMRIILSSGKTLIKKSKFRKFITSRDWNHPTTFIVREIYQKFLYRTNLFYADFDLVMRIRLSGAKIVVINKVLANFRKGGISTGTLKKVPARIKDRYCVYRNNGLSPLYFGECAITEIAKLLIR